MHELKFHFVKLRCMCGNFLFANLKNEKSFGTQFLHLLTIYTFFCSLFYAYTITQLINNYRNEL